MWWTLVAEKDYKMLNRHRDSKLLDRYLNEGAATKTVPAKYNKFVRTASASRTYGATPQNNYLPREVKPGSPMFIPRDPLFTGEFVFCCVELGEFFITLCLFYSGKFEGAPRNSGSRIKPEDVHQFEVHDYYYISKHLFFFKKKSLSFSINLVPNVLHTRRSSYVSQVQRISLDYWHVPLSHLCSRTTQSSWY